MIKEVCKDKKRYNTAIYKALLIKIQYMIKIIFEIVESLLNSIYENDSYNIKLQNFQKNID